MVRVNVSGVRALRSGTDEAKRSPGGVKAESRNQSRPFRHKFAVRIQIGKSVTARQLKSPHAIGFPKTINARFFISPICIAGTACYLEAVSLFSKNSEKYPLMDKVSGKKQLVILVACVFILFTAIIASNMFSEKKTPEPDSSRWALIHSSKGWTEAYGAPNASSLLLMQINNDVKVQLLEDKGDWIKIRAYNGRVGYVRREFLRAI